MKLSDFDYHLPEELIAQHPPETRAGGRLLDVSRLADTATEAPSASAADLLLTDLPELLAPGSLLVFNDTRVINARLFGRKESGGRIEVMVERLDGEFEVLAMVRASHAPKEGSRLFFGEHATDTDAAGSRPEAERPHAAAGTSSPAARGASATVMAGRSAGGMMLRLRFDEPAADVLERLGSLPLPPYIQHQPDQDDQQRYQTVFAREPGAVAAPTAGLHFDEALLAALAGRGIESTRLTLHVGAGTFLPVRTENLDEHRMHSERYLISPETAEAIARTKAAGKPVVAVGTTSLRALEASGGRAGQGETDIFIRPGHDFRVVDRLFTNFHLPRSTLLILVSAFAGRETIRRAYAHAIDQRYRFFSYGDAMLLDRAPGA
ncbi:MAG: tRNA preQ1(34) S-adenosylmethionine ribosyltransferase-isomerase QueA [Lautropia sp.]|nr:tRNA preQ1(34) S-adenosylmethionine ribosyltransferase-isomerase QueA [Lautropia sp.]